MLRDHAEIRAPAQHKMAVHFEVWPLYRSEAFLIWESNQLHGDGDSRMRPFADVVLDAEEVAEFEGHWRTLFPPGSAGHWVMREDLVELFRRSQRQAV